ncbi:hypothetical protein C0J52_21364 [Blattella germanica]|nr:hypothetical protein C0J52_21364 [Blattella germanica]
MEFLSVEAACVETTVVTTSTTRRRVSRRPRDRWTVVVGPEVSSLTASVKFCSSRKSGPELTRILWNLER